MRDGVGQAHPQEIGLGIGAQRSERQDDQPPDLVMAEIGARAHRLLDARVMADLSRAMVSRTLVRAVNTITGIAWFSARSLRNTAS